MKGGVVMKSVVYNEIMDNRYIGIITVLDYEISLKKYLSGFVVNTRNKKGCKVIIDLGLKVGLNEYRFVACDITENGKILWSQGEYATPSDNIIKLANSFLLERIDILSNSILSHTSKLKLLKN